MEREKLTSTPLPVENLQANTSLKKKGKEKVIDEGTSAHPKARDEESYEEESLPPSSLIASKHFHESKGTRSSLLLSFLGQPLTRREATKRRRGNSNIPEWNHFSNPLVEGVMEIARAHLADEGFLVTLSPAEHLGKIEKYASKSSLQVYRTWTLMARVGYLHLERGEEVMDLTIGLFYHKGKAVPYYDRVAGEEVDSLLFPAKRSCIAEGDNAKELTRVNGQVIRGGAKRSFAFFEWLVATFTLEEDHVIDVFAGCGGLGVACAERFRHCLLLEGDIEVFEECLESKACGPLITEDDI